MGSELERLNGGLRLEAQILPVVNYALEQNGGAVVRSVTVTNGSDRVLEGSELSISASPALISPVSRVMDRLLPGETVEITDLKPMLSGGYLAGLTERVTGTLTLSLTAGGRVLATKELRITALAFDQWHGLQYDPQLLAAFVTPNHPRVAQVVAAATEYLKKWTGDSSMDGYQSRDPNRVLSQAAAIFTVLKKEAIAYAVPPAGFEETGQRVRLADAVLQQKLGTCLDLSLLYAGCLEAVGLHPLLICTTGHAFVGLWLEERMFPECVQDDGSLITKRLASGVNEMAVVETTMVTTGADYSFDEAREAAGKHFMKENPECILDVCRARLSGVYPLPQRIPTAAGWEVRHDASFRRENMKAPQRLGETITVDNSPEENLPKMAQWERKLLDLGMRNTLINLRLTKTQLPILTNSLDQLENALAGGGDFHILPRPADCSVGELTFEKLTELGMEGIIQAEFENRRLRCCYTQTELMNIIKGLYRTARSAIEENGANTLYLALGLLRWFESERSTRPRYAPIILLPIEMVRKSAAQGYVIRLRDDEPQMNVTLLEKLKQDFGISIRGVDPLPMDEQGIDIRRVLTIIRQSVMSQPHWDVLETATLGIFSFSQFVMWNDIRNRADDLVRNKVVSSLMEGKLTWQAKPMTMAERICEDDVLQPMPADASQLYAIQAACGGESFVLHGPPGTGKSQTITSLIANALAKGKRVLFVAEKMAALSVVQKRLEDVGIGPFCLELHSNKSRKKDVLEQLRRATEVTRTTTAREFASKAEQLKKLRGELDEYAHALHTPLPCGMDLYGLINAYEQCRQAPDLELPEPALLRSLTPEALEHQTMVLERLVAAGQEVGHPHGHPLSRVGCTAYTQSLRSEVPAAAADYEAALDRLLETASALEPLLSGEPFRLSETEKLTEPAKHLLCWYRMPPSWSSATAPQIYFDEISQMAEHFLKAAALEQQLLQTFRPEVFTLDAAKLQQEYMESASKWFLSKMMGTNRLVKQLNLLAKNPISKDALPDHLNALTQLQQEKQAAQTLLDRYGAGLDRWYAGAATDWNTVADLARTARDASAALSALTGSEEFLRRFGGSPELKAPLERIGDDAAQYEQCRRRLYSLLSVAPASETAEAERQLCRSLQEGLPQLREWIAYCATVREAQELGLGQVTEAYAAGLPHEQLVSAARKATYRGLIDLTVDGSDALNRFSGAVFHKKIEQYKQLDAQWTQLSRQEIYCRLAASVPDFTREAAGSSELGILQRSIRSGGRGISIRRLFDQIPNLLPRLCPCMLMSPISAAQYLDPKSEPFDIVVFDEASQLPTCKAVGVLARGKEAVIVGDPKQMPPTAFFATNTVDEDHLEDEDLESILDDCLALNMPQSHLLWHYRSRHESLIAFSNSRFYENKLYTFPSVNDRASRVRLVEVEGFFERGKSRVNRGEAKAVIDELKRRCHDPALCTQSVGVVTFNIAQQNLIDDLLSEACTADQELEKWAYGSSEPLFIKNLENVQGDERDVILFSIGYGPDEQGKVTMNFGPLNRDGGWRRLNVAVSRARCEMVVFYALKPEQIDLNRTSAEGVAALRGFLEYAKGRAAAVERTAVPKTDQDAVASAICGFLKEQGYDTDRSVGRSRYRLDIGVVDPENPEQYRMGILLDGEGYGSAATTRDRELAQISVLKGLGWQILRVFTMDWWDDREKECARILKALKAAPKAEKPVKLDSPAPTLKAAPPAKPESLPVYEPASLPVTPMTAEEFILPGNAKELKKRIRQVIKAEAPISAALLQKRVLQSYGITRAGSRMLSCYQTALRSLKLPVTVQSEGEFLWAENQSPEQYSLCRRDGVHRELKEIPVQELSNALIAVLREQISMNHGDLLREAAKKLGYQRLGTAATAALEMAVVYAETMGTLICSGQMYKLS